MNEDTSDYVLSSPTLPAISNNNVILSNSFIGHRLHGDTVYMNGLYNGYTTTCHRARIPCHFPYVDDPAVDYTLDCKNATYKVSGANFEQVFYAHSVLNRVFVTEISVHSGVVNLSSHAGAPSTDLNIISKEKISHGPEGQGTKVNVFGAEIKDPETKTSPKLTIWNLTSDFPATLDPGTYLFISSFASTHDEALSFYDRALQYYTDKTLLSSHQDSWSYVWKTVNIDLDDKELAKTVKSSLFYLLSSFPQCALKIPELENYPFQFFGVSPGSLGNGGDNNDYWGHVFWDQDFWMLPGVMLLFPELVKESIKYRIAMLPGARIKAKERGYKGAMYPWESGRTGIDVCPGAIYANHQQHITACVNYAIRQYVYVTGSWDIVSTDGAWDVVNESANFWLSRVEWDGNNFVINNVMDPDEYHSDVNNSCFTNAAARLNLLFAVEAAERLGKIPDPRWAAVAQEKNGLKIPFDETLRYHPEFDGYTQGTIIKQASVVMLGYPLGFPMDDDVRKNDIEVYAKCTDKGPGMTYSMYCIGMLELDELATAENFFQVQFQNLRDPFRIWNEYPTYLGCTNFLTAIGGFLQSLLFGYLGLRVFEKKLQVKPFLLPKCTGVTYTGMQYCGERFNFEVKKDKFTVCRTTGNAFQLWQIEKDGQKWPLVTNKPVSLDLGQYEITMADGYELVY